MQLINPLELQVRWLLKLGIAASVLSCCVALAHMAPVWTYYKLAELYKTRYHVAGDSYLYTGLITVVLGVLNLTYSGLFLAYLTRTRRNIARYGLESGLAGTLGRLKKIFVFQIASLILGLGIAVFQSAQFLAAFERIRATAQQH